MSQIKDLLEKILAINWEAQHRTGGYGYHFIVEAPEKDLIIDSVEKALDLLKQPKDIQVEVGLWAENQFSQSTNSSICEHLRREAEELKGSFKPSEAADCFLILLHFAHKNKFDLFAEALKKHAINKNRNWAEPDEQSVVEHIEEAPEQPPASDFREIASKFLREFEMVDEAWNLYGVRDILHQACDLLDREKALNKELVELTKKFPESKRFASFADFAIDECLKKPSMAVHRNKFHTLATFLRACEDRTEELEAALAKGKQ